jgi:hypothetical protein
MNDVDFALNVGLTLTGVVTSAQGPVDGAQVQSIGASYQEGISELAGQFVMRGFAAGATVELIASKEGFGPSKPMEVVFNDRDAGNVRLLLEPEASIAGVVVDPAGRPVPRAMVLVNGLPSTSGGAILSGPNTDSRGAFHFGGLSAGDYSLSAQRYRAPNLSGSFIQYDQIPGAITVALRTGERKTGLRLLIQDDGLRIGTVSGTVRDRDGRPLEGGAGLADIS